MARNARIVFEEAILENIKNFLDTQIQTNQLEAHSMQPLSQLPAHNSQLYPIHTG
jgi:hypothetical protein